jgi:hypothetical protein
VLFDALTVFFLLAGSLLLVLNIWHSPGRIILTKLEEQDDERRAFESMTRPIGGGAQGAARVKIQKGRLSDTARPAPYRFASKKTGVR